MVSNCVKKRRLQRLNDNVEKETNEAVEEKKHCSAGKLVSFQIGRPKINVVIKTLTLFGGSDFRKVGF